MEEYERDRFRPPISAEGGPENKILAELKEIKALLEALVENQTHPVYNVHTDPSIDLEKIKETIYEHQRTQG